MELIINQYGAYLSRIQNRFQIQNKDDKQEYSADQVTQIIISTPISISSGAIELAQEHLIDIVFLNIYGEPYARIYPCRLGGTTLTRKRQAEIYQSPKSADLAKKFVEGKIKNQILFLKALYKDHPNSELHDIIQGLDNYIKQIKLPNGKIDEIRDFLLGVEGWVANRYFKGLSTVIKMVGRRPEADDQFNILLNYGYGILYSEIERACIVTGLDPYLGYYHTDRYGKPCMVLDLIEEFRPVIVDRVIVTLLNRKQINDTDFEKINKKVLSNSGRKKVIKAIYDRLHTEIKYKNKKIELGSMPREQARQIVRYFLNQNRKYEPFIYRW